MDSHELDELVVEVGLALDLAAALTHHLERRGDVRGLAVIAPLRDALASADHVVCREQLRDRAERARSSGSDGAAAATTSSLWQNASRADTPALFHR